MLITINIEIFKNIDVPLITELISVPEKHCTVSHIKTGVTVLCLSGTDIIVSQSRKFQFPFFTR